MYGFNEGIYTISETINGKPSWISDDQAIWWVPGFNNWAIGSLDFIGSDISTLAGIPSDKNFFGWPYDQKYFWKYWKSGSGFTIPGANDIKVQCKGNTYLYWKIVKSLILM